MQKIVDYFKQYIGVISIVLAICILLTYSLSYFMVNTGNKRVAEMYLGELQYSITIDGNSTNTLSVPAGETIVDINVTNQNGVDTYFELLYLKNDNVTISYYDETKDTSETYTKYLSSGELLEKGITGTLKLKIINNSSSAQTLTFSVSGGYSTNKLTDVDVPNSYSEITTMETTSSNTYFCDTLTSDPLSQGTKYTDGQYTYRYKQEGNYSSTTDLAWNNISDGWGVQLTDKSSTDPVTSKVCTYINNKPVISMRYMFKGSQATSIDLSSFSTSNVTNMSYMFHSSQATSLDLSSFNTSNVTDMSWMFYSSQATTLDVSSFNTSNVINMRIMFTYTKVTNLDVSNFNTSNVDNMEAMFANTKVTNLDLSNFNTSNVTNMSDMFSYSQTTTLDLSSFDTSKVINMSRMFSNSQATTLDLSSFNTSNVKNMSLMFWNSQATTLDLSSFNTSKVTDMSDMFYLSKVKTIYASNNFITDNVTSSTNMFKEATNLVGGNGTKYNSSHVDKTYARIDKSGTPGYFTLKS